MKINNRSGWYQRFLLLSVTLGLTQGFAWAQDVFPLPKIDFVNNQGTTKILLHTGSIVPYRTILASENKLVIDIDQVQTDQTIHTNFSGAQNVSHVILQPLSQKTLRLIVRGDHLGQPSVGFQEFNGTASQINPYNNASDLPGISAGVSDKTPNENASLAGINQELKDLEEKGIQPAELRGNALDKGEQHIQPAVNTFHPEPISQTLPSITKDSALHSASSPEPMDFLDFFKEGLGSWILSLGLLTGVLIPFALFIKKKWQSLQSNGQDREFEELLAEQTRGRKQRFQDLASAYQQTQGRTNPSLKSGNRKPNPDHAPIGLRSLRGRAPDEDQLPLQQPKTSKNIQTAEIPPRQPAITTPPKKQALNQYQKQANPMPVTKKKPLNDELLRQEVQRSADVKRQMGEQAPQPGRHNRQQMGLSSQPQSRSNQPSLPLTQGRNQTPLPASNPEVLNFLRSVAELMEKDGNKTVSRTIRNKLTPS